MTRFLKNPIWGKMTALAAALILSLPVAFAQNRVTVKGTIVDENGEPMIGAAVLEKNTTNGVITDIDGTYSIQCAPGTVLQYSSVGYLTEEKTVPQGGATFDVQMQLDNLMIEETVVIGYGVQKKSNVTGAISSIKSDDLANAPITNAASALQGKVSGVQIVNASGQPGAAPTIRVRGYSSNGSSDPLYIVDGLKVSDISYLEPSSILSMEVLKDAASAAIYGAEAGNGVVLITTKSGAAGQTRISFDGQWTISTLAKKVDLMNSQQFNQFYTEALEESFTMLKDKYYDGSDTDWQDQMYTRGVMQKYNLGVQGGNEHGKFFVSLNYMDNQGMLVMDKDYYNRISGQINASYKIRPWLEVSTANTITSVKSQGVTESNIQYGFMKSILQAAPTTPVKYASLSSAPEEVRTAVANGMPLTVDKDGNYYGLSWFGENNPMRSIEAMEKSISAGNSQLFVNGMTSANLTPFKNFVFTSRLGYTLGNVTAKEFSPAQWYNITADPATPNQFMSIVQEQNTTLYWQWENFANYTLETKAGDFSLMAGMSYSDYNRNNVRASSNELSSDAPNYRFLNYSTSGADDKVSGYTAQRRQIAYYGRLSWDYGNRYNAQFNFRADSYDAAYLDLDHNWGFFPSASFGWTFSNENFMKNIVGDVFSYGKLRASYGINGSISNLGGYMYRATLTTGPGQNFAGMNLQNNTYYMDGVLYQGTRPSSVLANPLLRWERHRQVDVGLDLRFFNGRLNTTVDYFHKTTDGLLVQSIAPLTTGASTVWQNVGMVVNSGVEVELEWKDTIGKDFNYSVKGSLGTVKNYVKEYKGEGTRINGTSLLTGQTMTFFEEGYPVWYLLGYKYNGVDPATGEAIYEDVNKDGNITTDDRVNLGSAIPDFTYGITVNLSWKNFDFMAYGTGAQGNKLMYAMLNPGTSGVNRPTVFFDGRWTPSNTNATQPSALFQVNDSRYYGSSAMVFDASYFKIKQIQLGYTLPEKLLKKASIQTARMFVSLDNFFTFTKYIGSDPELNASGSTYGSYGASAMALDFGGYPLSKSVSFGVNVAF